MSVQLAVETDSLTKRGSNSPVWGQVYLRSAAFSFPESGWTDMAVGFCLYWIQALQRIEADQSQEETVRFMDGPYKITMRFVTDDSIELDMIECRDEDQVWHRKTVSLKALLEDGVSTAQNILRTCEQNRWIDGDIEQLASTVAGLKPR